MPENRLFRLSVTKTKTELSDPNRESLQDRAVLALNTEMQTITPEQPSQIEYRDLKDF